MEIPEIVKAVCNKRQPGVFYTSRQGEFCVSMADQNAASVQGILDEGSSEYEIRGVLQILRTVVKGATPRSLRALHVHPN